MVKKYLILLLMITFRLSRTTRSQNYRKLNNFLHMNDQHSTTDGYAFSNSIAIQNRAELIKSIYNADRKNVFSVSITGGGVSSIEWLLTIPGASRSIMNAQVPYSRSSLSKALHNPLISSLPSSCSYACDEETAKAMAYAAYHDALSHYLNENHNNLSDLNHSNIFGISCTAALISSSIKKGLHRCYIATYDKHTTYRIYKYIFQKGLRNRIEEDQRTSELILKILYDQSILYNNDNNCHIHQTHNSGYQIISSSLSNSTTTILNQNNNDNNINDSNIHVTNVSSADTIYKEGEEEEEEEENDKEEVLYMKTISNLSSIIYPYPSITNAAESSDNTTNLMSSSLLSLSSNKMFMLSDYVKELLTQLVDQQPDQQQQQQQQQQQYISHILFVPSSQQAANTATTTTTNSVNTIHNTSDINNNNDNDNDNDNHVLYGFQPYINISLQQSSSIYIYSGSFNPLHVGHIQLVQAAIMKHQQQLQQQQQQLQQQQSTSSSSSSGSSGSSSSTPMVIFEISAINVDKPPLTPDIITSRIQQFHPESSLGQQLYAAGITNYGVMITSKPLFLQKAQHCFPGNTFIIGCDTFSRLIDPFYYKPPSSSPPPPSPSSLTTTTDMTTDTSQWTSFQQNKIEIQSLLNMMDALSILTQLKCTFIVGGRINQKAQKSGLKADFETMDDVLKTSEWGSCLPIHILRQFIGLLEVEFRIDLSSTQVREEQMLKQQSKSLN